MTDEVFEDRVAVLLRRNIPEVRTFDKRKLTQFFLGQALYHMVADYAAGTDLVNLYLFEAAESDDGLSITLRLVDSDKEYPSDEDRLPANVRIAVHNLFRAISSSRLP